MSKHWVVRPMIRASIAFESHMVKETVSGLESHMGDGRLNRGLSFVEDPISTVKVESYEHA